MKKIIFVVSLFIIGLISISTAQKVSPKVLVYYFHATNRCNTCLEIEKKTKLVLLQNFKDELQNGIIKFETFDYEDSTNKTLVEKYFAYGSTLLLVYPENEEQNSDLTEMAFQYIINKPEKFKEELSNEIEKLIISN